MKRHFGVVSVGAVCLMVVGLPPGALAQVPGDAPDSGLRWMARAVGPDMPPGEPAWGTTSPIAYVVPGISFNNRLGAQHNQWSDGYIYLGQVGVNAYDQAIHLPSGAVVDGVTLYCFVNGVGEVDLAFNRWTGTTSTGFSPTLLLSDAANETGGYQGGYHPLPSTETIRNFDPVTGDANMYILTVDMHVSGYLEDTRFGGVVVWYRLQISPAPASATFSDVPTGYWAFRHIEALAASGITAGCGGGNFCPESYVKRSEMAVYLAKALGLHWPDGPAL